MLTALFTAAVRSTMQLTIDKQVIALSSRCFQRGKCWRHDSFLRCRDAVYTSHLHIYCTRMHMAHILMPELGGAELYHSKSVTSQAAIGASGSDKWLQMGVNEGWSQGLRTKYTQLAWNESDQFCMMLLFKNLAINRPKRIICACGIVVVWWWPPGEMKH